MLYWFQNLYQKIIIFWFIFLIKTIIQVGVEKVDYLDEKTWENVLGLSLISNSFKYLPISL